MMKKLLFLLIALPFFAFSQTPSKDFEITGNVTGYPDGTSVSFLNQQTGAPEKQASIEKGKFVIKGNLKEPSFIVLVFGDQPPAIPLFIDNSKIKIDGDKNNLENLSVTGSKSQNEFAEFSKEMKPYEKIFMPDSAKDPVSVAAVEKIGESFVKKYPSSYVAPIAIIRILQSSENATVADNLYKLLSKDVKNSTLAQYVGEQLELAKINPIGSQIADFTQADTAGRPVKISSLRGKYVLIDFWASWCRPCRMENPNVVAAFNKYHEKNFTVLGVSLDQAKDAWLNAIHMDGLTWTHVSDLKGWGNQVAALFKVTSIPQNILIDPKGKIIGKNLRGEALNDKLSSILN
jgi:peroxiredoxin